MAEKLIKTEKFIANLPLFRELGREELTRIAGRTTVVRRHQGETLFERGDPCTGFHAVVYGQVKLTLQTARGDEKVVELIGAGHSFGEAVMFLEKPYVVTATALADSMLLHIGREAVYAEIDRDPRFARRIIAALSRRLHHLVTDLEAVSLRSGTQRVVGYLLRKDAAPGAAAGLTVTLPAKKGIIASRLNLTQEHFSRILHELIASGLIEVNGREIRIPDIGKLRDYGA